MFTILCVILQDGLRRRLRRRGRIELKLKSKVFSTFWMKMRRLYVLSSCFVFVFMNLMYIVENHAVVILT